MKKIVYLVLMSAQIAAGCSKDEIQVPESTVAPVPEITEDDQESNTVFTRTITVVFSDQNGATVTGVENGIVTVNGNQVTVDNTASLM